MAIICERCRITENDIRLFDAIYEGRGAYLCERCAIVENIPIIKKPNISQLKESEREKVHDRMKRITGFREGIKKFREDTFFRGDRLKELEKNPQLELPEKKSLNLIDHFHWEIMKHRRRKGMSQKQLAQALRESETAIQMIENGKLPGNAESLIKKLEQFFQVKLRKISYSELLTKKQEIKEPILLNEHGKEIEILPEEEMIFIEPIESERISDKTPEQISLEHLSKKMGIPVKDITSQANKQSLSISEDLDIKSIDKNRTNIGDLQKLHKKRIEATRQEKLEEQKKIEERQRILEALRERDRLKLEEKKKQEFLQKQESEDIRKKLIDENKKRLEEQKIKESKDIDRYLGGSELIS